MIRRLPPTAELILVNLICFGPFAAMSIADLVRHQTRLVYDDPYLYTIVAIELVAGAVAVAILRARGWTAKDLGLSVSMPLTIGGMVLFIGANLLLSTCYEAFRAVTKTDPGAATEPVASASWLAVLILLAIDPIYEETFEVAYTLKAAESSGPAFAITLSAMIRFVCHLHHGPIAALTILPLGLIFGAVYWKWRRVWPLVIAHAAATYFGVAPGAAS